jgi:uncharacterized protein (DUF302 family)
MNERNPVRGTWRELSLSFDEARAQLPELLKQEGFGVLTQVNLDDVFDAKLGERFPRYTILGACNPSLAHAALSKDLTVGLMLPCNVVLYERDDGRASLGLVDPVETLGLTDNPAIVALAREVQTRLARVAERALTATTPAA